MGFAVNFTFGWRIVVESARENQQGKDNAEGHVEPTEQRGNQRAADAADTKAQIDDAVVLPLFRPKNSLTSDGNTVIVPPKLKATQAIAAKKVVAFSGANSSAAMPTSETTGR